MDFHDRIATEECACSCFVFVLQWPRLPGLRSTSTVTEYTGRCSIGTKRRSIFTRSWARPFAMGGGLCCSVMMRCRGWRRKRGESEEGKERKERERVDPLICDSGGVGDVAGEESSQIGGLVAATGEERLGAEVDQLRRGA